MQGVIKSYDPGTGDGVVVRDTDRVEYDLAGDALGARSSACCARASGSSSTSTGKGGPPASGSGPRSTWEHRGSRPTGPVLTGR